MQLTDKQIRNVVVFVLLAISFPSIAAYISNSINKGLSSGFLLAIVVFILFLYLNKEY